MKSVFRGSWSSCELRPPAGSSIVTSTSSGATTGEKASTSSTSSSSSSSIISPLRRPAADVLRDPPDSRRDDADANNDPIAPPPVPTLSSGPFMGRRLRLGILSPGLCRLPNAAASLYGWLWCGGPPARTIRMFDGNVMAVGVAGSALVELRGDLVRLLMMTAEFSELDELDDALECEWRWCTERTDETDEDVDLRPCRPADGRRNDECGVSGVGDSDVRRRDPLVLRTGVAGAIGGGLETGGAAAGPVARGGGAVCAAALPAVEAPFESEFLPPTGLFLDTGDLARLASQCRTWFSWFIIGCWCHRLRRGLRRGEGESSSGLARYNALLRDSFLGSLGGGGGGRCLEELSDRLPASSAARGASADVGEPIIEISGSCGSSGGARTTTSSATSYEAESLRSEKRNQ